MDAIIAYFAVAMVVLFTLAFLVLAYLTRFLERIIKLLESIECDVESMSKDSWEDHHNL